MSKPTCSIDSCERLAVHRGWCARHYKHWTRYGHPLLIYRGPGSVGKPGGTCSIEGCEEAFYCRTWCPAHYERWRRNGDPLEGKRSGRKSSPVKTRLDAPPGYRHCLHCDVVKPLFEFHNDRKRVDGISFYCKLCNHAYVEAQRARDPEKYLKARRQAGHKHRIRVMYGFDSKSYMAMLEAQGGVCAICKNPETSIGRYGDTKALPVDHNHITGKVRGLLCDACNKGLGAFGDDVVRLAAAIDYLVAASMSA